jgi:hypothetical protein
MKLQPSKTQGAVIDDRRTDEERELTQLFVVATDSFMSGWGFAPGKSYFAVPCTDHAQAQIVLGNMEDRTEMKRPRIVGKNYKPRLRPGDHLSIRSPKDCDRFYIKGGFR